MRGETAEAEGAEARLTQRAEGGAGACLPRRASAPASLAAVPAALCGGRRVPAAMPTHGRAAHVQPWQQQQQHEAVQPSGGGGGPLDFRRAKTQSAHAKRNACKASNVRGCAKDAKTAAGAHPPGQGPPKRESVRRAALRPRACALLHQLRRRRLLRCRTRLWQRTSPGLSETTAPTPPLQSLPLQSRAVSQRRRTASAPWFSYLPA